MVTERGGTTARLVGEARRGRSAAFAELYRRVAPKLYLWARAHVRPPLRHTLDPEDLLQEVWCRGYRELARYDPSRASFRTWIFAIARNVLCEQLRRIGNPRQRSEPLRSTVAREVPDELTSVTARLARAESVRRLLAQIEKLADLDRRLVLYRAFEGEPFRVVAERLGITEVAAESRWRRLRAKLRASGCEPL